MPESIQSERQDAISPRTDDERRADREAIAGSIAELLPALIAKLGATGLAELEIRQDGLRVRLRRPPDGAASPDRRSTDRTDRSGRPVTTVGAGTPTGLTAVGPGRESRGSRDVPDGRETRDPRHPDRHDEHRTVATSPAVGIFQPRTGARAGTRVRAGDRIGTVDMLGVPQEVVAPADGLIGASLVEPGDAVEFGQRLVVIEFASPAAAASGKPGEG